MTPDIGARLGLYGIDENTKRLLRAFRTHLEPHLDGILDRFYADFVGRQSFASLVEGRTDILKSAQREHWMALFGADFDEAYAARTAAIGEAHVRVGVPQEWYFAGYRFALQHILRVISGHIEGTPEELDDLRDAVTAAVMLDMDLAMSVYAARRQSAESRNSTSGFADTLMDRSVNLAILVNEASISNVGMYGQIKKADAGATAIAAAAEQMSVNIRQIAERTQAVNDEADSAHEVANSGRETVAQAVTSMQEITETVRGAAERVEALAEASEAIGNIVTSIDEIASQTNLLALNATIEAARAGEAGKGFAVVATEVKSLAQQTSRATEDIRTRITKLREEMASITAAMTAGTEAVDRGGQVIGEVNDRIVEIDERVNSAAGRITEVSEILAEQTKATDEIAGNVSNVAQQCKENLEAVDQNIKAMRGVENMLSEQLNALAEFDVRNKVVRIAKADHVIWKKRLVDIVAGLETLKPSELSDHHSCRLGKWYYSAGASEFGGHPSYVALEEPHARVHAEGIKVAQAVEAGDIDTALEHLAEVEKASADVIRILDDLAAAEPESERETVSAPAPAAVAGMA